MKWIDAIKNPPMDPRLEGKEILILVNGVPYLCSVMEYKALYLTDNRFLFSKQDGWSGDRRFSKPTHWMEIPEFPRE